MYLHLPQHVQDELFEDHKQRRTRARNDWRPLNKHPIMKHGKGWAGGKRQYDLGGVTSSHDPFISDSDEPLRVDQVIGEKA